MKNHSKEATKNGTMSNNEATDHTARSHTKCDENAGGLEEFFTQ